MKNFLDKTDLRRLISRIKEVLKLKMDKQDVQSMLSNFNNEIAETYATKVELSETEAIAKGRATGYVFDTETDLFDWLADTENVAKLVLGDNLYVRDTDVPDYWWDGTTHQILETQKVDLSEYAKKSSIPTKITDLKDDTDSMHAIGYANFAEEAGSAYTANTANIAERDANGADISKTYATKAELIKAIGEALESDY